MRESAASAAGERAHPLRRGRSALAVLATLGALAAMPPAARAHGLVQRADLPIPEWLFAWGANGVLIVSFVALAVAWPTPRLEPVAWRPLPEAIGRALTGRALGVIGRGVGVALLGIVVATGYLGSQEPTDNLAPTLVLIVFWVGLAFASVLAGDIFRTLNPWRGLGDAAGWVSARRLGGQPRGRARRPYPERLGHWPAAVGLLGFTWVELASEWGEQPDRLATAVVVYTVVTLAAMAVYGVRSWIDNGECFSVYFGLLARMSVFERRGRRLGLRPPLAGLAGFRARPGTVALISVMIGSVSFDGLSQGGSWRTLAVQLNQGLLSLGAPIETAIVIASTLGLLACVALVGAFYRLGVAGVQKSAPAARQAELARSFGHALVPIAFAYVVAHYLTYLLYEGQAIGYLASDPLGRGWDLFGTASSAIDFTLINQTTAWYLQVAAVVIGHVAGLALAHDRALVRFPSPRAAIRSQYWLLAVMVGFTTLALWLLAESSP